MKIHGKEIGLRFTCGASAKISKLCPNGDIGRMNELFADSSNIEKMMEVIGTMAVALNEGYELNRKYEVEGYEPNPITFEEVMTINIDELATLQEEIIDVMTADAKGEIEIEPPKGAKKK